MKKEDKIKIYNRIFKWCFFILFITFLTLYFSQGTGYFEFKQHQKVVYTKEQIEKFEEDVANGRDVHIEDYVENTKKDYSNKVSDLGYYISENLGNVVKKGIEGTFSMINKMVEG